MKKLTKQELNLVVIQFVDTLAYSMASIFFTVFLFINSNLKD